MKYLKKNALLLLLTFALSFTAGIQPAEAQCPMCRASVESNLKNGGRAGRGLNMGILFMLSMPYLVVGILGYVWWRNRKKEEFEENPGLEG